MKLIIKLEKIRNNLVLIIIRVFHFFTIFEIGNAWGRI